MRAINTLAATFVLIAASSVVAAYPIPPQTLRHLYHESDLIVVAKVGQTITSQDEEGWALGKVTLQVSSVLKGPVYTQNVDVYYVPGLICPAPPRYKEGETVLAFLHVAEDRAGYITTALSYGTKYLSDSELKIYTERITELARLMSQEKVETAQIVEWLVRCAEETATRWEGAYELFSPGSARHVDPQATKVDYAALLTDEQKTRLTEAFFRSTTISWADELMLDLIKDRKDERLIPFVISYLNSVADTPPYGLDNLMLLVAQDSGSKGLARLSAQYGEIYGMNEEADGKRKKILRTFINSFEKARAN
jgi:hypothetical protein